MASWAGVRWGWNSGCMARGSISTLLDYDISYGVLNIGYGGIPDAAE